jgi:hypothetical protein
MSADAVEAARLVLAGALPFAEPGPDGDPLARLLYDRWFHATTGARRRYPEPSAYRAIALAARPFEPGWTVEAPLPGAAGAVRLRRGGRVREAPPLAWAPAEAPRIAPAPGAAALAAPLRDGPQGGFWHLWSPVWPARQPRGLRRWYLQVADGGEAGVAAMLAAHAPAERAWAAKLLSGEHLTGRRDVAVFYAPIESDGWLETLFDTLAPQLSDRPGPPFTEPLRPGIARAEDPGGGLSFGQHRCQLLAAAARGRPEALGSPAAWRDAVARRFVAEGLRLDAPWRARR